MPPEYDYLIVGAGFFGAVFARELTDAGARCLVVERQHHVAGHAYTEVRDGIVVHVHGPHIFHCTDERIWGWVNRFAEFNRYVHMPKVNYRGRIYSFPINLMTLHQLWGVTSPAEARARLDAARVPIERPDNLEDWVLSQLGPELYETFIRGYTAKQWQRDPKELPSSIVRRLPIRLTFDENYFDDPHQGIPVGGYTRMFERILDGIEVRFGVDYLEERAALRGLAQVVVWTGAVDAYFDNRFGALEYRSLRFEHETLEGDFQGVAQMNYTSIDVPWTRIVEHKHFEPERLSQQPATIVTREYSEDWAPGKTPYYPIGDACNRALYARYEELARAEQGVIFGGRLAEYKYFDMHQVIGAALARAGTEIEARGTRG